MPMDFTVLVTDNYRVPHYGDHVVVTGFASLEGAIEYARRRTWASVEEMRPAATTAEDLRAEFLLFGESSAVVVGDQRLYNGRDELDYFVTHPASENERDWLSLEPMH